MQPSVTSISQQPTVSYDTAGSTETARMLRTLIGNLDGMVYRCRDDADWTMEFVSEGVRRLTGYDASDLLFNKRVSYEQITHPEDRERVRREMYAGLRTQGRFDCEYRIVHATGETRWVWERGTGIYDIHGKLQAIEGLIQDITIRKASSQALREAERRYYNLFENAIEGIFRTSIDGQYLDANPALARIYGFDSPAELIAQLKDIGNQLYVEPSRREEFMALAKARGSVSGFESQVYRKSGEVIWISENARAVFDETGHVVCYEGTVEDITERKLYQARIEQQANFDTLTGLANRSLLHDRLQQDIRSAAAHGTRLAVVFVDLDRFKFINDGLGHHVGDELLRAMAERLRVRHQLSVRILPADVMPGLFKRLDLHARQIQLSELLAPSSRAFALAEWLAVEAADEIEALVRGAGLGRAAEPLLRRHLTGYFAAALMMPYGRFLRACEASGYDVDLLQRRFGASFEQVAHRLTTLQRVGARGLPFFMLRVDRAGQVSKRYAGASGSPIVEGAPCPLWNGLEAFARPDELLVQLVELEDRSRWLTLARCAGRHGIQVAGVRARFAVALGLAAGEAGALAWSRGVELGGPAVPIGPGCRACLRPDCPQRSAPPAGRAVVADERERGVSPVRFAGD